MFYPQTLVEWSNIASVILVIIVLLQTIYTRRAVNLTREEMENRLRPWISRKELSIGGFSQDRYSNPSLACIFWFKNYGGTPAINSRIKVIFGKEPLELSELSNDNVTSFGSIMPSEERKYTFFIPQSLVNDVENKNDNLYVLVSLDYEFSKTKSGTYSILAKYYAPHQIFEIIEDKIA